MKSFVVEIKRYRKMLGLRVRLERLRAGLTIQQLAGRCMMSAGKLQQIEVEATEPPTVDQLVRIATVLELTPAWFLKELSAQDQLELAELPGETVLKRA